MPVLQMQTLTYSQCPFGEPTTGSLGTVSRRARSAHTHFMSSLALRKPRALWSNSYLQGGGAAAAAAGRQEAGRRQQWAAAAGRQAGWV